MVTIKDIAQVTGVSCTTVSNVIHGRAHRVSAETIEKINAAIKQLGYVPNMSARSLVSNSSKVIGFINHVVTKQDSNFMEDPFHSVFIGVIEHTLRQNGYYLMLRTVETADELLAFLQNWNVDGLFFTGIFKDTFFDALTSLTIPVVLVDSYVHQSSICNIGLEDYKGSFTSTSYLISKGHKRIAFASPSIRDGGVLQERFLGYKAALEAASIPFDPALVVEGEMDYASCLEVSEQLVKIPALTGLVVTADVMAAGIMAGFRQKGVLVPDQISVVGFDDISLCKVISPPLTTIHQDMNQKGALAVDMMLQKLEGHTLSPAESEITLPIHLVERDSVRAIIAPNPE